MGTITCIDIRKTDNIDFKEVKASGIDAVILQAGSGEHPRIHDLQFDNNYVQAKAAGLKVGAYWESHATSMHEARREAAACYSCICDKELDLPVYYVMKNQGDEYWKRLNTGKLNDIAKTFCIALKCKGYAVGIQSSLKWFKTHLNYLSLRQSYSIWLRDYSVHNSIYCDIWQAKPFAAISGVPVPCGLNIIYNNDLTGVDTVDLVHDYKTGCISFMKMLKLKVHAVLHKLFYK